MKKDKIWSIVLIALLVLLLVLILLMKILDKPDEKPEPAPAPTPVPLPSETVPVEEEKEVEEDTSYYYYVPQEPAPEPAPEPTPEPEQQSGGIGDVIVGLLTYDEKAGWGVKSATNELKNSIMSAGTELLQGDTSGAVSEFTEGIGEYLGNVIGSLVP